MSADNIVPVKNEADEPKQDSSKITRWMVLFFGGLAAFIVIGLIVAILGGAADSEGVSNFFRILRDFFVAVLFLQGVLICAALVLLILQLAALINVLTTEVKPLIDEARETIATARGTTEFVTRNVASPVIRTSSTVAGAFAFVREITNIRRILRGRR